MDIFLWLSLHWDTVVAIVAALHTLALLIVNITPTPADNRILAKIYRVVEVLAGILTRTAKELPGERHAPP